MATTPDRVEILWSETRYYRTVVSLTDLEDAVRAPGPVTDGHPLPEDLSKLEGDALEHGDLDGLLTSPVGDADESAVHSIRILGEGE